MAHFSSYLVPRSDETSYCSKNSMQLVRLKNGAAILGISRNTTDSNDTSLSITFPSGYYFDPPNKNGLHHLLEHSINMDLVELAEKCGVSLNAQTETRGLRELVYGPLNKNHPDFGLPEMLPHVFAQLKNPLFTEEKLLMEKSIVKAELNENNANHEYLVNQFFTRTLMTATNPATVSFNQTTQTIDNITLSDVESCSKEVFIPSGTIVSIVTEGSAKSLSYLITAITQHLQNFPRTEVNPPKFDWALYDLYKQSPQQKVPIIANLGLKDNVSTLLFAWQVADDDFSVASVALRILCYHLSRKFFTQIRRQGLGYSAGMRTSHGEKTTWVILEAHVPKQPTSQLLTLSGHLQQSLAEFFTVSPETLKNLIDKEKKRDLAMPAPASSKLNWAELGLIKHNQLFDFDKIRHNYLKITKQHLKHWLDLFTSTPPFCAIVGDVETI